MTPEEKLHQIVFEILCELKQEQLATPENRWIFIDTQINERRMAIRLLSKNKAIKAIGHQPAIYPIKMIQEMNGIIYKPNAYKVDILQPKFNEVYKKYKNSNRNSQNNNTKNSNKKETQKSVPAQIEITSMPELKIAGSPTLQRKDTKQNTIQLYLNNSGELWREPKEEYCYPMGQTSHRYKIIRLLVINTGYQSTKLIAIESGSKNEQTTRTEIRKIRSNIKKYLKIDGKNFLEGKKDSGYRINLKHKVILKNE